MDSNMERDSIMDDLNSLQQLPEITITTTRTNKDEEPQHFYRIQKKLNTFHNYKITLYNTDNLIETNHIQQIKLSLFKNNQIVGCYISHQNNNNNSNGSNNNYDSLCINHRGKVKNECFNQVNEVTIKPIPRPLTFNEKSILLSIIEKEKNEKEKWKSRTERFNQLTGNDVDSMYLRSCYGNLQRQLKKSKDDNLKVYNKSSCKKEDFKICEKYLTIKFRMVDNSCYKIPQNNQFKLRITIIVKDNNNNIGAEKELNFDSNLFCIISKERSTK